MTFCFHLLSKTTQLNFIFSMARMLKNLQAMKIKSVCQNKVHLRYIRAWLKKGLKQNKLQLSKALARKDSQEPHAECRFWHRSSLRAVNALHSSKQVLSHICLLKCTKRICIHHNTMLKIIQPLAYWTVRGNRQLSR